MAQSITLLKRSAEESTRKKDCVIYFYRMIDTLHTAAGFHDVVVVRVRLNVYVGKEKPYPCGVVGRSILNGDIPDGNVYRVYIRK